MCQNWKILGRHGSASLCRDRGVRQDHVRSVIADSALLSSMEMYAFLLRPGLAALDNLADKYVAGWLLPSKVLDLSYPTLPYPTLPHPYPL